MISNLTDRFIDDIHSLHNSEPPDTASHHAKRCLLDYLGATLAGTALIRGKLESLITESGDTNPVVSLIGLQRKTSIATAALVNGISSHAAELDDGVISGIVHPGTPVFSALLPAAQKHRCDGRQLLLGIIGGYEATVRLANAIQPSHKMRGYHATATCGAIGATCGILLMLNGAKEVMKNAFSAAAVSAGGSLKVLEDGSQLKPFNSGHAALSAVVAVSLARVGFAGPNDVLAGNAGFLAMAAENHDQTQLFPGNGAGLCIENVYFKPYAACRYCHPAIEAALRIDPQSTISPDEIKSIKVSTYKLAVAHHDHTVIGGISSAKMSIPFSVAVALVTGRAGIGEYSDESIRNQQIARLTKKVAVVADDQFTARFPQETAARVELTTNDGQQHIGEVSVPKGEPTNPLSDTEVDEKFLSLANYAGISSNKSRMIRDSVWSLPDSAETLYELL